jgi:hypothetical protein
MKPFRLSVFATKSCMLRKKPRANAALAGQQYNLASENSALRNYESANVNLKSVNLGLHP